tara:strand:+ start:1383 stop:1817 length:435 start_codon:yes stop_codon:yes gene_type:complete
MKLDQLRKIIREEVRSAVKDELQEMLNEAVKAASAPSTQAYKAVKQKDLKRTWSTGKMNPGTVPLEEMLNQTKSEMTGQDFRNVVGADSSMVKKPNFASNVATSMGLTESSGPLPGIDISKLDFVGKAKAIYDKSIEKDKSRLG